jgi:hypothetical protein
VALEKGHIVGGGLNAPHNAALVAHFDRALGESVLQIRALGRLTRPHNVDGKTVKSVWACRPPSDQPRETNRQTWLQLHDHTG